MSTVLTQTFTVEPGRSSSGVADPVTRVIVVGAGVAGLATANALQTAGVETILLEARGRVGGRVQTVALNNVFAEAGGSWVHDPIRNPVSAFAQATGIPQRPFSLSSIYSKMRLIGSDGQVLDALRRDSLVALADCMADEIIDDATCLAPTHSIAGTVETHLEKTSNAQDREWLRFILRTGFETDLASPLADISVANFFGEAVYEGDETCLEGGYRTLIARLADGLDITRNAEVIRIVDTETGIAVHCSDGRVMHGSHVVVTVPLGVLKAQAIEFPPALPLRKLAAINTMGFGLFEKLFLQFDEPFWRGTDDATGFFLLGEPVFSYWIDLTAVAGSPLLVAHVAGSQAAQFVGMDTVIALKSALMALQRATGRTVPAPSAVHRTSWWSDVHARGSYAHWSVASASDDIDALAAPASARLLFAGEATAVDRYGYVDGAFSSGLREAARLLGTPSVELRVA